MESACYINMVRTTGIEPARAFEISRSRPTASKAIVSTISTTSAVDRPNPTIAG